MANGEVTTGKVIALIRALSTSSTSSATYTVTDALILGAATTSGVRLDLESGVLAVREGDDSAYASLKSGALRVSVTNTADLLRIEDGSGNEFLAQGTNGAGYLTIRNGIAGYSTTPLSISTAGDFYSSSAGTFFWRSGITSAAAADTGLARDSAGQVKVTDGSTGVGNLRATALIVGTADTNGVRLDLESGALAVREGDDSAYAQIKALQVTSTSVIEGLGTGYLSGVLLYSGSYTSTTSVSHASSGRVIHNASASGDIEITLPAMAGKGSFFVVFVGSANYLKITANAADKIRNGATASVSGGYIRSNTVGSAMLLVGTGTSDWSVIGPTGTWTIDS